MSVCRGSGWRLAVGAVFVVAACKDSTAPQPHLSDPAGLSSDIETVSGVLRSPMFQSFDAASRATGSPAAAPSQVGTLLRAAPIGPPGTSSSLDANAAARTQASRRAAAQFSAGISASVVPPALLGTTWVWNTTTHAYEQDPSATPAAPTDRVRIILYAVDPSTGHIVGQVTGNPAAAFTATAAGFVSDGTHTLTFSATFAATQLDTDNPDLQIDVTWNLNNPGIQVELHEAHELTDADHATFTLTEFSITTGVESVSMSGTVTTVLSTGGGTVNLAIDVNGVPWAQVYTNASGVFVRHADGTLLSPAEGQAFRDLYGLPAVIEFAILSLFSPCQSLMGA